VLDGRIEHGARRVDSVAGVCQALDALIVFRPLLDLEEVALVGVVGVDWSFPLRSLSRFGTAPARSQPGRRSAENLLIAKLPELLGATRQP
jgi:hypothetical protein